MSNVSNPFAGRSTASAMAVAPLAALFGGGIVGVIVGLFLLTTVFPIPVAFVGAFVANQRKTDVLVTFQGAAFYGFLALLALMALGLVLARIRQRAVSIIGATTYVCSGLALLGLEAYSAASMRTQLWPTTESLWTVITHVGVLWQDRVGALFIVGGMLIPMVLGMVSDAAPREEGRDRAPITRTPDAPDGKGSRRSRVQRPRIKLDDLAGMEDLKRELGEFIQPFKAYGQRGAPVSDVNGLLLSGPPGNGKTAFAEAIAGELGFGFIKLGVKDLTSSWVNGSADDIAQAFAEAVEAQPCVLFLDEFDAVGTARGAGPNAHAEDSKVVDALLVEIDALRSKRVLLMAATNHPDQLDSALVRPGRFDRKIEVPYPDMAARCGVLRNLLAKHGLAIAEADLQAIGRLWERRSVAFIEAVVKRVRDDLARTVAPGTTVNARMLKSASRSVSRREGAIPRDGAKVSELVLPISLRRDAQSLVYRLANWETLAERGGTPPKGVLLYGPPGTGKTNLVRAIARELGDWHVFEVKTADILHDPRRFTDVLDKASEHRPAIVFLDEADDLLRDRSYSPNATATNEILKAMDGMMGAVPEVVFFAATNNPDAIDAAAKRGGRFSEKVFMDRLRGADLLSFASADLARRRNARFAEDVTPSWLAEVIPEIGPADLIAVVDRAVNATLVEDTVRPVGRQDVADAYAAITEGSLSL